ncbi:aaa family ATPase [Immersiella caudata]|uniref:Aaa family ATPase n=1 Tax=Immersiella caudata TaxID=314043 RepID=A0AA39TH49_9PEZI|nr:aaa family ATPase [Immersiella caudata]
MDAESQIRVLEQKYTRLLETRVAELENRLLGVALKDGTVTASSGLSAVPTPSSSESGSDKNTKTDAKPNAEKASADTDKPKADATTNTDGQTSRYRVVVNRLDSDSGEYKDKLSLTNADDETKSQAFTFRKRLRMKRMRDGEQFLKATGSEVEVHFPALQVLLERVLRRYSQSGPTKTLQSPFEGLIFSWEKALEEVSRTDFDEGDNEEDIKLARADLGELMKMVSTSSGDEALDSYFKTKEAMKETKTITFKSLWTLFPPGSLVVSSPFLDQHQVFFVQRFRTETRYSYQKDMHETNFHLIVYSYDWDGSFFNRVAYEFSIPEFEDKKSVFELPIYPINMHQAGDETAKDDDKVGKLKASLIRRGKEFRKYCIAPRGKQTVRYEGMACYKPGTDLFGNDDDDSYYRYRYKKPPIVKTNVSGAAVVDFKSFLEYQPPNAPILGEQHRYDKGSECSCDDCKHRREDVYRFSWDKLPPTQEMTEEQYLLCPPRVLGYSLKDKKWMQFAVESLKEAEEANSTNFNTKLQLGAEHKELIWKSVRAHKEKNILDYTPGKGNGLVILLWGIPGVGKTLTAESVASLVGKPQFSVGVSDIGLEGSKVESNLQKMFDLAGLWEAVLLFDEADVFLEARDSTKSDIHRNTIVSVLLRVLEYYNGILFLTTNRLMSFDIAVQSRIHISIEYSDLEPQQRENIFTEFLQQLKHQGLVDNHDWGSITRWVSEDGKEMAFNGRQIRNIVSTAMAVAHADKRHLLRKDLVSVANNTKTFKKALQERETLYRNLHIRPFL